MLGYTQKWFEYFFITEPELEAQIVKYNKGDDKNSEHYRYGTLQKWIKAKQKFSDQEIEQFIEITTEDSDLMMSGAAFKILISSSKINEKQFDLLASKFPFFGDWANKILEKMELIKEIDSSNLSSIILDRCLELNNRFVLEAFVVRCNDIKMISQIMTYSKLKAVRNIATEKNKSLHKKKNASDQKE